MHQSTQLKERTKEFAIRIVRMFQSLPRTEEARILGRQVLRSGTSVAANYCAVCRSRSRAEFVAKIGTVVEEMDETVFWLELLTETSIVNPKQMDNLRAEANELLAIFAASQRTVKSAPFEAKRTHRSALNDSMTQ
ncbi:MAG: four helix bundle protein [Terriglobia bacterium]